MSLYCPLDCCTRTLQRELPSISAVLLSLRIASDTRYYNVARPIQVPLYLLRVGSNSRVTLPPSYVSHQRSRDGTLFSVGSLSCLSGALPPLLATGGTAPTGIDTTFCSLDFVLASLSPLRSVLPHISKGLAFYLCSLSCLSGLLRTMLAACDPVPTSPSYVTGVGVSSNVPLSLLVALTSFWANCILFLLCSPVSQGCFHG